MQNHAEQAPGPAGPMVGHRALDTFHLRPEVSLGLWLARCRVTYINEKAKSFEKTPLSIDSAT